MEIEYNKHPQRVGGVELEETKEQPELNFKKAKSRLTFSQIVFLYQRYVTYTEELKEHGTKYSQRTTLSDVAEEMSLKKSTVHYYFSKVFPKSPYYLSRLFFLYKKRSLSALRVIQLSPELRHQERKVVDWILRMRQAGLVVTYNDIRDQAKELITCKPNLLFSDKWVKNFMRRHDLSLRKSTHRTVKNNMIVIQARIDTYLKNVETFRKKWNYSDDMIINFDETAVFFDFEVNTVDKKGKKFVRTLQVGKQKQRLTCGITVCASGDVLPCLVVYNQKSILNCADMDLGHDLRFFYTKSGWVKEDTFIYWLKNIILPYVKRKRALLVFDTYSAHISKQFQKEILKYDNLDIALIPGGLTHLLQPLDVSFNHSFKTELHKMWKSYLSSQKEQIMESYNEARGALEESKSEIPPKGLIQSNDIKNSRLRRLLKKGFFEEARKKNVKDNSTTFKLVKVDKVVEWIDQAMQKMRQKRRLIRKSFKICGLNHNLNGDEDHLVHNFDYLKNKIEY